MTYTFQDKPLATDILSQSQSDLRQNFDYEQAAFGKDHQTVFGNTNATTFEGRHLQVSLPDWSVVSSPGTFPPTTGVAPVFPSDGVDNQIYSYAHNIWSQNASTSTQITPCLAILAAAKFTGAGSLAGSAIGGMTCTKVGTGNFTINFTNPLSYLNYFPYVTYSSGAFFLMPNVSAQTATSLSVQFGDNTNTNRDPNNFYVIIYTPVQ
jgi:hypothetical protein